MSNSKRRPAGEKVIRRHPVDAATPQQAATGSNSWMNLVERYFGDLTQQAISKASVQSVRELARRIEAYIAERDLNPKRYAWRPKARRSSRKSNAPVKH